MHRRYQLLTIACVAVIGACSDPLVPGGIAGIYDLRTFNGVPVPLPPGRLQLVSGTVTLRRDWHFERRTSYRIDQAATLDEYVYSGTFQIRGDSFEVPGRPYRVRTDGLFRPTWHELGRLTGDTLSFKLASPADGYDYEMYVRR